MERLIKDGDIILDGTAPRYLKEKWAFEQLELLYDFIDIFRPVIGFDIPDKDSKDMYCAVVGAQHNDKTFIFMSTFDEKTVLKLKKIKEMLEQ